MKKTNTISVRLNDKYYEQLVLIAAKYRMSISEVIRYFIIQSSLKDDESGI